MSELNVKFIGLLPDDYEQKVKMFTSDFQQVADQLRSLIYRTMCPSLIDQASVSEKSYYCMKIQFFFVFIVILNNFLLSAYASTGGAVWLGSKKDA